MSKLFHVYIDTAYGELTHKLEVPDDTTDGDVDDFVRKQLQDACIIVTEIDSPIHKGEWVPNRPGDDSEILD